MPQTPYVLEMVDVRRATQSGNQRGWTLNKMVLPPITHKTISHTPGGGIGQLDIRLPQIEPIEPKFEVKGIDEDVIRQMARQASGGGGDTDKWTFAGAFRDKRTGKEIPCRAVIEGVICAWQPDEHEAGNYFGCNYEMKEVSHYEFIFNGVELWYWDFWERVNRSGGFDAVQGLRNALGG